MTEPATSTEQAWVIWNGLMGALDTVSIGRIEVREDGARMAHLRAPYEMAGPFNLDELETRGFVHFAACVVMSLQHWREFQGDLRRDAQAKRRAFAQSKGFAQGRSSGTGKERRHDRWGSRGGLSSVQERWYRRLLGLPQDLPPSRVAINSAYRRLAKSAHPDAGGTHEAFLGLTEARDALLNVAS
jgi:hypothetical protein